MKFDYKKLLTTIGDRLRERSTYAGLTVVLSGLGVVLPDYVPQVISVTGMFAGGLIAIFVPDGSK